MPGHSVAWRDWQRREDYYAEGVLLWLDVDAHLRELTHGSAGLDQFAQRFFATHGRTRSISTYAERDLCTTLNQIAAENWQAFLQRHLQTHSVRDDGGAQARGLAAHVHFRAIGYIPASRKGSRRSESRRLAWIAGEERRYYPVGGLGRTGVSSRFRTGGYCEHSQRSALHAGHPSGSGYCFCFPTGRDHS